MSTLDVARIVPGEAEALRDIRLEALLHHPEAFSRDPDVERAYSIEQWRDRISDRDWFACRDGDNWAGIAMFARDRDSRKTGHTGSLGSMYVRQAFRGKGAADLLVSAVLAHAASEVEQIVLTVNAENTRAISLYERHGFRTYGRIPRSIRIDDRYYDELEMFRPISLSD